MLGVHGVLDVLDMPPPLIHAFLDELKEKTKELIHEISRLAQQCTNEVSLRNTPHTAHDTHDTRHHTDFLYGLAECVDQLSAYADAIKAVDAKYKGLSPLFQIEDDVLKAPGVSCLRCRHARGAGA